MLLALGRSGIQVTEYGGFINMMNSGKVALVSHIMTQRVDRVEWIGSHLAQPFHE